MPNIQKLAQRLDAEFPSVEAKLKKFQVEQHKQRQKRRYEAKN